MPESNMVDVIRLIKDAGGVPVVAHPHGLEGYAEGWVKLGVMGFETHHPDLDGADIAFFEKFCDAHRLYKTGGTDRSSIMGGVYKTIPQHDLPPSCGYTTEEQFMKLYRREWG